jgi:hypothetical protein
MEPASNLTKPKTDEFPAHDSDQEGNVVERQGGREAAELAATKTRVWMGRIVSALVVAFLLFDGGVMLLRIPLDLKIANGLGLPLRFMSATGLVLIACTIVHLIPRTAVLGAILLTGWLGGAVAVNALAGSPTFSGTLLPVYFAAILWWGLALRDERPHAILASRKPLKAAAQAGTP